MKTIHNIFSTEKITSPKKQLPKKRIIIDYREKNSLVASYLVKLGFEIHFKELKVADYIIKGVAIERKTIFDFIQSMKNKRLINQLEELKQYKNKLLLIEGIEEQELYNDDNEPQRGIHRIAQKDASLQCFEEGAGAYTSLASQTQTSVGASRGKQGVSSHGVHANAIRGFLLSILLKHKIPIIFTKDYRDTARFMNVIANKKQNEKPIRPIKKSLNKNEQIQFILEGFPGIGPKTAKKLIKEFGTLKNIINSSYEDLEKVIGKKAKIFEIVG